MKALLDYIARYESRDDYNIVWSGIKGKHKPPRPLVDMTISQVLAWQDRIDPLYMSEAAGRYQIMEDTLRGLYGPAGLSPNAKFSEKTQDDLAVHLMKRRGLDQYMAGKISAEKFANSLAREWASLPLVNGPKKGRSYYAGDGLNKAHADADEFLRIVKEIKGGASFITLPGPKANPITALLKTIAQFFKFLTGRK